MSKTLSAAQAKARLSECLRAAEQGESVLITRHGKPIAAVVPAADVERLSRLKAAGPEQGLASIAGGWAGSDELVGRIEESRRTPPRRVPRRR